MRRLSRFRSFAVAGTILLAAGLALPVHAQDPDDMQRGVARISLMNGEVSVRRGDSGEWVAGVINAPLLSDDRIATGPNSRAEVEFDAANILRIGGNVEVRLAQLEANRFQMELAHGTITFRVLRPSTANVEIDTPNISVRPSKQGIYRITVTEAGETEVTSRAGDLEVFTPKGSEWLSAGQTLMARGNPTDPEFQIVNAIPGDDWDRWNDSRDQALLQSQSYQYVGQGVYGAEDLDAAGTWVDVAPYGRVWRPVGVPGDWAPYRYGRWVWEDWYGWTWVSYEPWGWAPYHYGRWFYGTGFGWCWYPGGLGIRHYWSPALVGFFGFGGGIGVGFGFGSIGWVPLAPFELFHPWWGRAYYGRGFDRFNVTNVSITNVYRNARYNGISGVSANDFRNGRFTGISRVSGEQVREAGLVRGQMPISPSAANTRFSDRAATHVPQTSANTRFFSHQQPNAAPRMPFSQQQGLGGAGNRVGTEAQNRGYNNPGAGGRTAQGNSGAGGWRRFGEPSGQGSSARGTAPGNGFASPGNRSNENSRPAPASGGVFQRFGQPGGGSQASGSSAPRYNVPPGSRSGAPGYGGPSGYSAPGSSAPRTYSAPGNSSPGYNGSRSGGGGGGYSAPRSSGGGSGGHSSGGGGGSRGHR